MIVLLYLAQNKSDFEGPLAGVFWWALAVFQVALTSVATILFFIQLPDISWRERWRWFGFILFA